MSKLLSLLVCLIVTAVSVCANQEDRVFGWSLKVEPADRKKKDQHRSRTQRPQTSAEEIHVDTDLVISDILVQDQYGNAVKGLAPEDFEISESGSSQTIDVFAHGDSSIPRSIVLVIDHSLSQLRYIDLSIASAKLLVDSMRPNDRMAIVSDDVELISDLTSNKEQLKSALESLRVKCTAGKFGKSSQYSALFAALNERVTRNGTRNIVIFQTDGDEFAMLRRTSASKIAKFGLDDIVSYAERNGVTIYTVFTGSPLANLKKSERFERARYEMDEQLRAFADVTGRPPPSKPSKISRQYILSRIEGAIAEEKAVASMAERTGGIAQSLESPDQAAEVYERILSDIGRRYLIGYYPPDRTEHATREREVRIILKNKGNFRVIGGRTYVAY